MAVIFKNISIRNISILLFFFVSCNNNTFLLDNENTRIVGKEAKTIIFLHEYMEYSDYLEKDIIKTKTFILIFPANTLNKETVIDIELFENNNFKEELFENEYYLIDIPVRFYPKDIKLNKKVELSISNIDTIFPDWTDILQLITIKENANNQYEINEMGKWKFDSLSENNSAYTEINNFEDIFCLAKPVIYKNDTVSLSITGDNNIEYSFIDSSKIDKELKTREDFKKNMVYQSKYSFKSYLYVNFYEFLFEYENKPYLFTLMFKDTIPDEYEWLYFNINIQYDYKIYYQTYETVLNLFQYGEIGERIKGNVSGRLENDSSENIFVNFNFSTIRVR